MGVNGHLDGRGGRERGEGTRWDESGRERIRKNKFVEMRCEDTTLSKTPIRVTSSPLGLGINQQNGQYHFHQGSTAYQHKVTKRDTPGNTFSLSPRPRYQHQHRPRQNKCISYACFCFPVRNFLK